MCLEEKSKDCILESPPCSGKGVVTYSGGLVPFANCYTSIKLLRKIGSTLPVEWFFNKENTSEEMLCLARDISGVSLIPLPDGFADYRTSAVFNSSFAEVVWQDPLCFQFISPETIFESRIYKQTGLTFAPDIRKWSEILNDLVLSGEWKTDNPVSLRSDDLYFSSGLFVVDRVRHSDVVSCATTELESCIDDNDRYHNVVRFLKKEYSLLPPVRRTPFTTSYFTNTTRCQAVQLNEAAAWQLDGSSVVPSRDFDYYMFCKATILDLITKWSCCL